MQFKNLYNHSLFVNVVGHVCRKHSNAFAVEVKTGQDYIPELNEVVQPISKAEASELTNMDYRYL